MLQLPPLASGEQLEPRGICSLGILVVRVYRGQSAVDLGVRVVLPRLVLLLGLLWCFSLHRLRLLLGNELFEFLFFFFLDALHIGSF